jgi:multidrug efflux pump subunit AcrB
MSIIPFSMIGAVIGHWIMGMELTIMSLLGMLALIGVVVNDSLVLVDFINKKRSEGGELMEALLTAGAGRFRAVMLTSLTTFIGLMPLLFKQSTQAQFLIPMPVSLGFGLLFATFITLILVPVNYLIVERLKDLFSSPTSNQQPSVTV